MCELPKIKCMTTEQLSWMLSSFHIFNPKFDLYSGFPIFLPQKRHGNLNSPIKDGLMHLKTAYDYNDQVHRARARSIPVDRRDYCTLRVTFIRFCDIAIISLISFNTSAIPNVRHCEIWAFITRQHWARPQRDTKPESQSTHLDVICRILSSVLLFLFSTPTCSSNLLAGKGEGSTAARRTMCRGTALRSG